MPYKCFYCQHVFTAAALPKQCPGCSAHLSLAVTADTLLHEWTQAFKKNGKRATFKLTPNGFVGAVDVDNSIWTFEPLGDTAYPRSLVQFPKDGSGAAS